MKNPPYDSTPLPGYNEKYYINRNGHVFRQMRNGTILPLHARTDRAGYLTVRLYLNGQAKTKFVHRLVAEAFVTNPLKNFIVNHINGNKTDNRAVNLAWVTHAENIQHGYDLGLITAPGKIPVEDLCSGRKFSSIKEAADHYKIPYSTCKNYLNGRYKNPTCLKYAK